MHGKWYKESKTCRFFMQARKICLVIDENTLEPIENYESFMCDNIQFNPGFVKFTYMRWSMENVEPTAKDFYPYDTNLEIYMAHSPYTMVNMNMDLSYFDVQSKNYRLEAMFLFTLFVISVFLSIFCYCFKNETFFTITEE